MARTVYDDMVKNMAMGWRRLFYLLYLIYNRDIHEVLPG